MRKLSEVRNCPYESFPAGAQDKSEDMYVCMYVCMYRGPRNPRTTEQSSSCGLYIKSFIVT